MHDTTARDLARRFTDEAWNRRDLEAFDVLLAEDFCDHDPLPGQGAGREEYKKATAEFFQAFPDLRVWNEDVIVEGNKAVLRWRAEGTHRGELMGFGATNRSIQLKGVDVIRVENGLIVERWGEFDAFGMVQQLQQQ